MAVDRVPSEFRYWDQLDRPAVRRLRAVVRSMLGFDPAPQDDVVRAIAAMYYDADPLCEAFVDEVYLKRGSAAGRAMLEQALTEGVASLPDAPASLRALFEDLESDPAWVDWDRVERGARAFRRYGTAVFRFAGAITLEGYAENSVAKPLALTGAYTGSSTRRRFLETAAFWIAVSEPGGLRPGAPGRGSAARVRVMHVFVRRKLLAHASRSHAAWGVPISQADAMLTLMGGSFAPGLAMHVLGYLPSRADIEAMMHFWRYVGHLMGVRPRWYPETLRDAAQLSFVTLIKGARLSGDDGTLLCRSYAAAFAPDATAPLRERIGAELEHRLHLAYTRLFVTPRSHRAHGLPPAGAWVLAPLVTAPFIAATELARRTIPGVEAVVDRLARRRRARWFARHMAGRTAEYRPVEQFTR
jgi:ER-bound oxygenase mpaB/B'/Rubber oxygenase, catalytic domain